MFPTTVVRVIPVTFSDHNPFLLFVFSEEKLFCPFKFKADWKCDAHSSLVVMKAWNAYYNASPPIHFLGCQNVTKKALLSWNRKQFGNVHSEICYVHNQLLIIQQDPISRIYLDRETMLKAKLEELLLREEMI